MASHSRRIFQSACTYLAGVYGVISSGTYGTNLYTGHDILVQENTWHHFSLRDAYIAAVECVFHHVRVGVMANKPPMQLSGQNPTTTAPGDESTYRIYA